MPLSPSLRLTPLLFLLGFAGVAPAQTSAPVASPLEEVDPDAKPQVPPARAIAEEEEEEEAAEEEATEEEVEEEAVKRPARPAAKAVKPAPVSAEPAAVQKGESPSARLAPTPLLAPRITDADLQNVWARWAKARRSLDWAGAQKAQQELITLADEIGAADLEPFSMGFLRAAEDRLEAGDLPEALQLTLAAVSLSPDFPYARLQLAELYARRDVTDLRLYLSELDQAVRALLRDPLARRPALADVGAAALFALLATGVLSVVALFFRKARYLFHDVHHLFPRGTARWQSTCLVLLLLSLPLVFRLGLVPFVLALFGSVVFYLDRRERWAAAVLILGLSALPWAAAQLVRHSAFVGTVAEDVYRLEQGGLYAERAAERVKARQALQSADFLQLFALGRFEARRGDLDAAIQHYKAAAAARSGEARLLVNLGNALLAKGDEAGAEQLYSTATQADALLAEGFYNLAQLHRRRAKTLPDETVGAELQRANAALNNAQRIDERLLHREDPLTGRQLMNEVLLSPSLSTREISALALEEPWSERIHDQLALEVLGLSTGSFAGVLAALGVLILLALGALRGKLNTSKDCEKCGRPVCRRCDPELGVGSLMCNQCVNAFARKNVVAPQIKARKQAEIIRYQSRHNRIAYALGVVMSGLGHLASGLPVRGALYLFAFVFALFSFFARQGVLRAPLGSIPPIWKLLPLGIALIILYLLSLRGLYKRQTE